MKTKESLEIFFNNIKKLRKHYDLSKKQMAEICRISVYKLNKIEQEDYSVYLNCKVLINLSVHFRYSTDTLMDDNILL